MKKVIKLTESDLRKIIQKIIKEENTAVSTKGSLVDIAKKSPSVKSDAPEEYNWMLDPEHVWEVSAARNVKVAGVPNPKGKYFKSKDFIELTANDGDLTFVNKGDLSKIKRGELPIMFGVHLRNNGIEVSAYWD